MKDIVILAGSTPWSVLSLCNNAVNLGSKAFVICVKNGWGRKYAHSHLVYKAYDTEEKDLPVFWKEFFTENNFLEAPILYVTSDYTCQLIENNRDFYERSFTLCVASSYIIKSFTDKNIAATEAPRHGLTIPKTIEVQDDNDVDAACNEMEFPVIVKPVSYLDHNQAGFKMNVCDNAEKLKAFLNQHLNSKIRLQCQEYIPGEDKDCLFYQFYRDSYGQIAECMGEKTVQSTGIMAVGTTKYDNALSKQCRLFLESIDYVGIGGIEFKRYNGKYFFIEMSTRTEGFLPISDMSGVSLGAISMLSLSGEPWKGKLQIDDKKYVVFKTLIKTTIHKSGFAKALKEMFCYLTDKNSRFVGAYLDWWFTVRLDLGLI